ncbi:hypothetical protein WPS_22870 [Vulcanimicrobium alpinum]|uniref:Uncharacterized protein n=1 Tax=Vulcanimicrobium alpinum TaxID=3016050 RepID=A0AAN1XYJ0_UNVUL|nr:hypothetical protein WPS_22870 [Vulcanimicrobium alpinum]
MHDPAFPWRCQTVKFGPAGFSEGGPGVYDAATMRVNSKWSTIALAVTGFTALAAPAARAADATATGPGVTLNVSRVIGAEALSVSGSAPAARPVEAALYATYSRDLPTVLLSRRVIDTDASGKFTTTIPTAPAYFAGAILTVVVRPLPGGARTSASLPVAPPNVPAPPDTDPNR